MKRKQNIDLSPEIVSKIKSLELRAKYVVEGFMVGLHKSPYHGFSSEFSQHRQYNQGDPIKNIDWKVWGKTDKYFVKEFEEDTNLICNIILDISKSMDYRDFGAITKLDYAKILSSSLLFLLNNQHDAFGLGMFSDEVKKYFPPKSNRVYLRTLLKELTSVKPAETTSFSSSLIEISKKIKKRGLVVIISDFLSDFDSILSTIKHFYYKKNEVIIFHLLDRTEKDFSFDKDVILKDMETGETLSVSPVQIREDYVKAIERFNKALIGESSRYKVDYNLITTEEPFDKALLKFFNKRAVLK